MDSSVYQIWFLRVCHHISNAIYQLRLAVSREVYQLRPKVSASHVSVASRVVKPKRDELRPAVSKELYQLHPKVSTPCVLVSRVVNRTCMSCIERCGNAKGPTI